MPELCFGILAARYDMRISTPLTLLSGVILVLGSQFRALWLLTYLAALLLSLWAYFRVRGTLRKSRFLQRLGEYSLLVFLLNGIVRDEFVTLATSPGSQLFWGSISAAVSFLIAAIIHDWLLPKPRVAKKLQTT